MMMMAMLMMTMAMTTTMATMMMMMMMMMMLMMMIRYEVVEGGRVVSLSNYSTVSRRSHEMSRTQVTEVILLGSIS